MFEYDAIEIFELLSQDKSCDPFTARLLIRHLAKAAKADPTLAIQLGFAGPKEFAKRLRELRREKEVSRLRRYLSKLEEVDLPRLNKTRSMFFAIQAAAEADPGLAAELGFESRRKLDVHLGELKFRARCSELIWVWCELDSPSCQLSAKVIEDLALMVKDQVQSGAVTWKDLNLREDRFNKTVKKALDRCQQRH